MEICWEKRPSKVKVLSGVEANGLKRMLACKGLSKVFVLASKSIFLSSVTWGVVARSPEPAAHGSNVRAFRITRRKISRSRDENQQQTRPRWKRRVEKTNPGGGYCTIPVLKTSHSGVSEKTLGIAYWLCFKQTLFWQVHLFHSTKGMVKCGPLVLKKSSGE